MMSQNPTVLRVARTKEKCSVLGPGARAVIWFHGCSLKCPGCIAHEMNHSTSHEVMTPQALLEWVRGIEGIQGITLSGGDPFDQAKGALLEFLQLIRAKTSMSVMCYTGRLLEELLGAEDRDINQEILACIDILIDGPYDQMKNEGHQWRGSSNQTIHFLTSRYAHLESEVVSSRQRAVEVDLSLDNRLTIAGIPEVGFMQRLRKNLNARGIEMRIELN